MLSLGAESGKSSPYISEIFSTNFEDVSSSDFEEISSLEDEVLESNQGPCNGEQANKGKKSSDVRESAITNQIAEQLRLGAIKFNIFQTILTALLKILKVAFSIASSFSFFLFSCRSLAKFPLEALFLELDAGGGGVEIGLTRRNFTSLMALFIPTKIVFIMPKFILRGMCLTYPVFSTEHKDIFSMPLEVQPFPSKMRELRNFHHPGHQRFPDT